ncbi:LacI family transcriptional regulator [Microbacterium sp. ZKA21]|uniref:LacI family DNA-binding transcriptional regulator n=1 Tax=Microbacterium sp. ZKA21 TaxID=3381694 RepID=UPI003D1D0E83
MVRRSSATTISSVAQAAGVSPATVSRVMNGRFFGEPEIADRVRAAARELNYSPNHLARSFAMGQTNAIAFLVPDLANPTFQAVLTSLSKAAAEDGYRVLVADSAESAEDEPQLAAEVRNRCDALVLCAPRMSEAALGNATATLGPVVLLNRSSPASSAPTLTVDSRAGFERLAHHLYALGHRRFAYVEGPEGPANENRLRGIGDLQRDVEGLQLERVQGGTSSQAGLEAVEDVIATGATAVLAFNDLVAIGLVHGATKRGIRVPEDMSITGFDDIPFARFMTPALTTASVPHESLGTLAWNRMRSLIAGETPDHDVKFQPRLELRESTGPCPR